MTTQQEPNKVSDMIRTTAVNQADFLSQIADHIDKLEDSIVKLQHRVAELENRQDDLK